MADTVKKIIEYLNGMSDLIHALKDNISDIKDIAQLPSQIKEVSELLLRECQCIDNQIETHDLIKKKIIELLSQIGKEEKDTSSRTEDIKVEDISMETPISLRPQGSQTDRNRSTPINMPRNLIDIPHPEIEDQNLKMRQLYNLTDNDYRYVEFQPIYPRINFLQHSPPEEVRYWYDFGSINAIYTTPPDFSSISKLPNWIVKSVKDCFLNNPTMVPKDILVLKFLSAGPDFHQDERYPSYHFIQLGKADAFSIQTTTIKKEFSRFEEADIHYRRAIGIRIVLQGMEAAFKKGFRTYGGATMHSSVMISFAKVTPNAAKNYLLKKMEWLEKGIIKSSPSAQKRLCAFRSHKKGICPACTIRGEPMQDNQGEGSSSEEIPDPYEE